MNDHIHGLIQNAEADFRRTVVCANANDLTYAQHREAMRSVEKAWEHLKDFRELRRILAPNPTPGA